MTRKKWIDGEPVLSVETEDEFYKALSLGLLIEVSPEIAEGIGLMVEDAGNPGRDYRGAGRPHVGQVSEAAVRVRTSVRFLNGGPGSSTVCSRTARLSMVGFICPRNQGRYSFGVEKRSIQKVLWTRCEAIARILRLSTSSLMLAIPNR